METSDEKKRNCWIIIQRVYLRGSWGRDKRFVLEMDLFRLCVGQRHWLYVNKCGGYAQ